MTTATKTQRRKTTRKPASAQPPRDAEDEAIENDRTDPDYGHPWGHSSERKKSYV